MMKYVWLLLYLTTQSPLLRTPRKYNFQFQVYVQLPYVPGAYHRFNKNLILLAIMNQLFQFSMRDCHLKPRYGVGASLLFAATGLEPGSLPVDRLQVGTPLDSYFETQYDSAWSVLLILCLLVIAMVLIKELRVFVDLLVAWESRTSP